ncbi:serine/threonine-protein kinase-like protein, partial [Euroglyphus maynei]
DLKLDNILLDSHWNPILTDFGFSRFVNISDNGQVQKSNTYCGTPSYNPPEILKQIPYNPLAADIWCLGIMLFIMINKIYPFDKSDREKMYECQMARRYKLRDQIEKKCTLDIKDLIDRLLEPNPDLRPNIMDVCNHPWFPVVLREYEFIKKQQQTSDKEQSSSHELDQQQRQKQMEMIKSPAMDNTIQRNISTKLLTKIFKIKQQQQQQQPALIGKMKK